MGLENFSFAAGNNRWQLIEIADEDHLHTAKGAFGIGTVQTQKFINTVEQISPHHGYFINDDGRQLFIDRRFFFGGALFLLDSS